MITPETKSLDQSDLVLAGIPKKYWMAKVADFEKDQLACYAPCLRYSQQVYDMMQDGIGLILHGAPGHGKTYMACALLKDGLRHRASGYFVETARLQRLIIDHDMASGLTEERPLVQVLENAEILVLDDLGAEHTRDWLKVQVEGLLRFRVARGFATIVTSNISLKKLEEIYGTGMFSVMTEALYPVKVDGYDRRGDAKAEIAKRFK